MYIEAYCHIVRFPMLIIYILGFRMNKYVPKACLVTKRFH